MGSGFSTTSTPPRSTRARTSSAAAPTVTSTLVERTGAGHRQRGVEERAAAEGSSCFGRPSRFEEPAASTRPVTVTRAASAAKRSRHPGPQNQCSRPSTVR